MLSFTPEEYAEKARNLFLEGYNCSQAVLIAFEDATGLERKAAARLTSSFGGGVSRLRELCGAFSAGIMVYGLLKGYDDPKDRAAKTEHYKSTRRLAERFRETNGSYICRELLGKNADTSPIPEARTETYYAKRPCPAICANAAYLTAKAILNDNDEDRSDEQEA